VELSKSFSGSLKKNKAGRSVISIAVGVFICVSIVAVIPLGGVFFSDLIPGEASSFGVFMLFCGGIALVMLVGPAISFVRTRLRSTKLEDAVVRVDDHLHPGESFDVRYEQRVNSAVEITSMSAKLVMREWVRWTSGTDTYTRTHDVVVDERVLSSRRFTSGSTIAETVRFQLPLEAMHTWANRPWVTAQVMEREEIEEAQQAFEQKVDQMPTWMQNMVGGLDMSSGVLVTGIDDNTITWHVLFEVAIPRLPDYNQAWELPVVPRLSTREERSLF
jgi:hypothetical protein